MVRHTSGRHGTGEQQATLASPPCGCPPDRQGEFEECDDYNHEHPNSMTIDGTKWKVGHDYLDTEIGDVCELVAIVGVSTIHDTRDPEDCPPRLIFEYERWSGSQGNRLRLSANRRDRDLSERFITRWTGDRPLGAPPSPW
jgi:hypothetical protein